jgi:rfaE bifunctional protein kinase chain/domain
MRFHPSVTWVEGAITESLAVGPVLAMTAPSEDTRPTIESLAQVVRAEAGPGRRICFVSGNFNVLHPGHLRLLRFAMDLAEYVVIGLMPDQTPGVTVPAALRKESLDSVALVNRTVLLPDGPEAFIAALKPEFVVKGSEFAEAHNDELAVVERYGGKLVFGSGEMQFSSLALLDKEFTETNPSAIVKPKDFLRRHGFGATGLQAALEKLKGMRVLVIGDLIVDDYITCDALGMSQEDPTIVVTPIETKTFVGGAGVVAAHAKRLGAEVSYFTVLGRNDEAATYARAWLGEQGIDVCALNDETRPTTRKQRFRANGKTLLRVNHLRQHAISLALVKTFVRQIEERLAKTDLILFSDFNYGCLPQGLVDAITVRATERGVMMAADSQASSQMADISRFKRMDLITPTEREARLAIRDTQAGLAVVAERLRVAAEAKCVVITLGSEGMFILAPQDDRHVADRLPAFNTAPKDVAGAGDSLFTTASIAMCAGVDVWQSLYLGATAAALQVGRVGNAPLSLADLKRELAAP